MSACPATRACPEPACSATSPVPALPCSMPVRPACPAWCTCTPPGWVKHPACLPACLPSWQACPALLSVFTLRALFAWTCLASLLCRQYGHRPCCEAYARPEVQVSGPGPQRNTRSGWIQSPGGSRQRPWLCAGGSKLLCCRQGAVNGCMEPRCASTACCAEPSENCFLTFRIGSCCCPRSRSSVFAAGGDQSPDDCGNRVPNRARLGRSSLHAPENSGT